MSLSAFINAAGKIAENVSAFTYGYNRTEKRSNSTSGE